MPFTENVFLVFNLSIYLASKFNNQQIKFMKTKPSNLLLALLTTFSFFTSACKKDNTVSDAMTEEEAAEVITMAVSGSANGLTTQTEEIALSANTYSSICSYSKDSTITKVNTAGAYTWNYVFKWQWAVICSNGIPNTMNANYTMKGIYDAPKMSSNDSAVANLVITNLVTGGQYTLNGAYNREGSQLSKIRNKNSVKTKVILTLANLKVSKTSGQIDSGSATASINGTTTTGKSFSYGGTITFNANRTATLTLNNGGTYSINW
jgi:hypothetical protein